MGAKCCKKRDQRRNQPIPTDKSDWVFKMTNRTEGGRLITAQNNEEGAGGVEGSSSRQQLKFFAQTRREPVLITRGVQTDECLIDQYLMDKLSKFNDLANFFASVSRKNSKNKKTGNMGNMANWDDSVESGGAGNGAESREFKSKKIHQKSHVLKSRGRKKLVEESSPVARMQSYPEKSLNEAKSPKNVNLSLNENENSFCSIIEKKTTILAPSAFRLQSPQHQVDQNRSKRPNSTISKNMKNLENLGFPRHQTSAKKRGSFSRGRRNPAKSIFNRKYSKKREKSKFASPEKNDENEENGAKNILIDDAWVEENSKHPKISYFVENGGQESSSFNQEVQSKSAKYMDQSSLVDYEHAADSEIRHSYDPSDNESQVTRRKVASSNQRSWRRKNQQNSNTHLRSTINHRMSSPGDQDNSRSQARSRKRRKKSSYSKESQKGFKSSKKGTNGPKQLKNGKKTTKKVRYDYYASRFVVDNSKRGIHHKSNSNLSSLRSASILEHKNRPEAGSIASVNLHSPGKHKHKNPIKGSEVLACKGHSVGQGSLLSLEPLNKRKKLIQVKKRNIRKVETNKNSSHKLGGKERGDHNALRISKKKAERSNSMQPLATSTHPASELELGNLPDLERVRQDSVGHSGFAVLSSGKIGQFMNKAVDSQGDSRLVNSRDFEEISSRVLDGLGLEGGVVPVRSGFGGFGGVRGGVGGSGDLGGFGPSGGVGDDGEEEKVPERRGVSSVCDVKVQGFNLEGSRLTMTSDEEADI